MADGSILSAGSAEYLAATSGVSGTAHTGTFSQIAPADLIAHWQSELEEATGFSLDSLFNVSVLNLAQRIDLSLGEDGFNVDIVPLGTNRLSYVIRDNVNGAAADFADSYDPGFALEGNAQDLALIDLFDGVNTGNRDFFVEYAGMIAGDTAGEHTFRYDSVGGFTLLIDGEAVITAAPGQSGEVVLDLPVGMHRIEIKPSTLR